ncbi:unnamed protein product [Amaranthus hypochondriacus]
MAITKLSIAIVLVSVFTLTQICRARIQSDWTLQYLTPHNIARAAVNQPPLVWNNTLATFARSYAKKRALDCKLQHSMTPLYGENIAMSPGPLSATNAVEFWISEKEFYNYVTNTCNDMCGHYSQIIWHSTISVGCASEKCQNGGTFITCNYYPPGNVVGEKPI